MGNVLSDDKKQQVVALGRLGWSLRRIEESTGVRRETVSGYLRAAGVAVRGERRTSEALAARRSHVGRVRIPVGRRLTFAPIHCRLRTEPAEVTNTPF